MVETCKPCPRDGEVNAKAGCRSGRGACLKDGYRALFLKEAQRESCWFGEYHWGMSLVEKMVLVKEKGWPGGMKGGEAERDEKSEAKRKKS